MDPKVFLNRSMVFHDLEVFDDQNGISIGCMSFDKTSSKTKTKIKTIWKTKTKTKRKTKKKTKTIIKTSKHKLE